MRTILPLSSVLSPSVPICGFTQLGLRSHPSWSFDLRPLQCYFHSLGLTYRFTRPGRSDQLVLASLLQQWSFLTSGIPICPFEAEFTIFMDASTQGCGAHMGDSQISGTWTPLDGELHINCLELKAVGATLHHWASVLQGHQVMIATDNSTVVSYQHARRDPVPYLVRSSSGAFYVVTSSEHVVVRARHFPGFCFLRLSQGTLGVPSFLPKRGGGLEVLKGALDGRVLLSVGVSLCLPPWSQN